MTASLHPSDLDKETRYELGKLRGLHDRQVHALCLAACNRGGDILDTASDPEMTYHLDVVDALIELVNPEEA